LSSENLGSLALVILLGEGFSGLLEGNEAAHEHEGPENDADSECVSTKKAKNSCQHRCHRILRTSCTVGNGQTAEKFR
jgi:hypothetical protein